MEPLNGIMEAFLKEVGSRGSQMDMVIFTTKTEIGSKGSFSKTKKSGNGRYTWKNGNYYDGNWNKDKMNGRGKFHWAKDGGSYEGVFKDGQIVNIEIAVTVDTPEKDSK